MFNHDHEAGRYDTDVADESNPVRAGYAATLAWVVAQAAVQPGDVVVDLGIGTGNLAALLPPGRRLVGVDVSEHMLGLARAKLAQGTELVQADMLDADALPDLVDVVVSTYAIHHLTAEEKAELVRLLAARLRPGGRLVVGDLMAAGRDVVAALRERLHHPDADDLFAEEFPWYLDETLPVLAAAGFRPLTVHQLSELSWGIAATRGTDN
jgi:putative AdoMet-dependent methyltransferase